MTFERRWLAGFKDILALRFVCKCGASLSVPIGESEHLTQTCPHCTEVWFDKNGSDWKALNEFHKAIPIVKKRGVEAQCAVHLEFEQPA